MVIEARISFEGALSSPFELKCGVKQSYVLVTTMFGIFFSAVLHHVFHDDDKNIINEGILLHTRTNGRFFNLTRLRAKTKTGHILASTW